jgi:hypothetical protein
MDYRNLIHEFDAWGDANGNEGCEMVVRMRHRAVKNLLGDDSIGPEKISEFIAANPEKYIHGLAETAQRGSWRPFHKAGTPERALAEKLTNLVLDLGRAARSQRIPQ